MVYAVWLFFISLAFVAAERIWPWRPHQKMLRPGIASDIVYLIFNSEYLGMLIALATVRLTSTLDPLVSLRVASGLPLWLQFTLVLLIFDFAQWCVHNLLHRVDFLWQFHKVHHSVEYMDWIGDWRFHWGEILVYRGLLYAPTAILGFDLKILFWYGILNTIIGHYAHANIGWSPGKLRFIFNTPQMHIWHHTHPDSGPINKNFGITLSIWDWIFRTAYMPDVPQQPQRLGFSHIESYPKSLLGQWAAPFRSWLR